MKLKVIIPFYTKETGIRARGEIFEQPDEIAKGLIAGGLAEEVKQPPKQKKGATKQ